MIRTAAVSLTLLGLMSPLGPSQDAPAGIAWEPDLATALARTKQDGKPTIAYFTFDA